ncbi:hypothetical protein EYF80_008334 [Liparis tanakae]|uniref:Uncharacterized protein n=1 Tax=Liparis tanakae TaxID=230148 RepID=A0A4Z2IUS2_9TELE|nr:hypothetical protein EYF80_008334 [Liparis tanakae]
MQRLFPPGRQDRTRRDTKWAEDWLLCLLTREGRAATTAWLRLLCCPMIRTGRLCGSESPAEALNSSTTSAIFDIRQTDRQTAIGVRPARLPLDPQVDEMPNFFRMGLKWEAGTAPASLGAKGFMVERISARQSATFLFGAQARAGVWPAEGQQGTSQVKGSIRIDIHQGQVRLRFVEQEL